MVGGGHIQGRSKRWDRRSSRDLDFHRIQGEWVRFSHVWIDEADDSVERIVLEWELWVVMDVEASALEVERLAPSLETSEVAPSLKTWEAAEATKEEARRASEVSEGLEVGVVVGPRD